MVKEKLAQTFIFGSLALYGLYGHTPYPPIADKNEGTVIQGPGKCRMVIDKDAVYFQGCNVYLETGDDNSHLNERCGHSTANLILADHDLAKITMSSSGVCHNIVIGEEHKLITSSSGGKLVFGNIITGIHNIAEGTSYNISTGQHNSIFSKKNQQGGYHVITGNNNDIKYSSYSFISGNHNSINDSEYIAINGTYNVIESSQQSVILSGSNHNITTANDSVILTGEENSIPQGNYNIILSGTQNIISHDNYTEFAIIASGAYNRIEADMGVVLTGSVGSVEGEQGVIITGNRALSRGKTGLLGIDLGDFGVGIDPDDLTDIIPTSGNRVLKPLGVIITGLANTTNGRASVVMSGSFNESSSFGGVVLTGEFNSAEEQSYATVLTGRSNRASGEGALVVSGRDNWAVADYSGIVTGHGNVTRGNESGVVGGANNNAYGEGSVVVGGGLHIEQGEFDDEESQGSNVAKAPYSVVIGGSQNTTSSFGSVIVGGNKNATSHPTTMDQCDSNYTIWGLECGDGYQVVVGGESNKSIGTHSVIVGGVDNITEGQHSTISGGASNKTVHNGLVSWIGGGYGNINGGLAGAIVGGKKNAVGVNDYSVALGRSTYGYPDSGSNYNSPEKYEEATRSLKVDYEIRLGSWIPPENCPCTRGEAGVIVGGSMNVMYSPLSVVTGGILNSVGGIKDRGPFGSTGLLAWCKGCTVGGGNDMHMVPYNSQSVTYQYGRWGVCTAVQAGDYQGCYGTPQNHYSIYGTFPAAGP